MPYADGSGRQDRWDISEVEECVQRARAGDMDAFAVLVERQRVPILRLALRLTGNAEDAQDVTQQTLLTAFENLAALRDMGRFGAWLRQIALNTARQWLRRERQMPLETAWEALPPSALSTPSRAEDRVEHLRQIVRDALALLPAESRSVVRLHYFAGYDYGETAALLGVPVSTVRGRLDMARRRLREEMQELSPSSNQTVKPQGQEREFVLTAEDIRALRGAQRFTSDDPARPELQAVCIEPDGSLVAMDAHRLYLYRGSSLKPPATTLVDRSLFALLQHRSDLDSDLEDARLSLREKEALLSFTDARDTPSAHRDTARLLRGAKYPNYRRVLPAAWRIAACVSVRDVLAALEEVARFEAFLSAVALPGETREGRRITLTLSGSDPSLVLQDAAIKAQSLPTRWAMHAEVPVALEGLQAGEEFTISLSRFDLRDCLHALDVAPGDRIVMRCNQRYSPVQIEPEGEENRLTLLMPLH